MFRYFTLTILCLALFTSTLNSLGQTTNIIPNKVDITVKQDDVHKDKSILDTIKDWLIPVSTFVTLLTVAVGGWQSLREYRLKLTAESRLANSTTVEMDIKLMQGFTQLLALAHARKGNYLSEKAVEKMFDNKLFTEQELNNPDLLKRKIEKVAVLNVFSGVAEQDAFIAAITNLGLKHEILKIPALQALETMQEFKPEMAKKYYDILKESMQQNAA